ncbi:nicotinate-nucleotide adenylyltransferase [Propionivibrio sp.]|uniref:nicotinate-nucleotide adenylyltransferase n=1 Tax=Propionivibrio sp. TaxID=2212460 RepID=UPI0026227FF1|nr:nicotinate-nucleotide adenylyltransferase [Propionivibrio sp.]
MSEAPGGKPLGVFGGTFDPVHNAHLRLAEEALDRLGLAQVRWIPAGQPACRAAPLVSAAQRLEMVRLAIAGNPRFELDSAEVDAAQSSYTVPTLERLRQTAACGAQRPLVLLVGADAFAGLPAWHRWESLLALAHIAVAHRPGFPVDAASLPGALASIYKERYRPDAAALAAAPAGCIVNFAMTQLDISATKVRALLSKGHSTRYLIPDALVTYIHDHHLYLEN